MLTAQTKNTQTLVPLTERVNVQADSARINQIIDGCWVAVGTNKPHAIQRDFTNLFDGKPSYRFELKTEDNTLEGYAKGETKGRAEFSYCYATSDDFKGLPADVYQKAQITKTVYHHGKGACPQGSSRGAASLIWAIARIRFSFCFNCLRRGAAVWFRLEIAVSRSSMVFREWAFR